MRDVYVTMRFQAFANRDLSPGTVEGVSLHLKRIFQDWSDGRRPFHVEAMQISMRNILEVALERHCFEMNLNIFRNERVELSPGSSTLRAAVEADKEMKLTTVSVHQESIVLEVSSGVGAQDWWKVLSREDRKPDGTPGTYSPSSRIFETYQGGLTYAESISFSRGPVVVRESQVGLVLAALNGPQVE